MSSSTPIADRFRAKIAPGPNGCVDWTGAKDQDGYGIFNAGSVGLSRTCKATKFAVFLRTGEAPTKGTLLRHVCDRPVCVNPDHLEAGTHADNAADKVARGRQARGETHGCAKLTEAQVIDMRAHRSAGASYREIGNRFDVDTRTAHRALTGASWAHLRKAG